VVEPETEGPGRRARRALWGFRLVFYPVAIAVGAILMIGRGDAAAGEVPLVGKTSQDASISVEVDGDGRPMGLDTQLTATCPNGHSYSVRWHEIESDAVPFRRDGSRLWVMASLTMNYVDGDVGRGVYTLEAQVGEDRVDGVLSFTEQVAGSDGKRWACASQPVGFTARR
jgi:hypothetical protein